MLARSLAISRHEMRILRRQLTPVITMIVLPLGFTAFIRTGFRSVLVDAGFTDATGVEHAVPGMTVMFAIFLSSFTGWAFFREHGWGTWERLRASAARPIEIIAGKVAPSLLVSLVQMGALFGLGGLLFGLRVRGSMMGLAFVVVAYALFLVAFGVALVSVCSTVNQMNTFTNIGTMVIAGIGGALVPVSGLPGWAQAIAPATPAYWAMTGFQSVILEGSGAGAVLVPVVALLAFAAGCTLLAVFRFRFEQTKLSWA